MMNSLVLEPESTVIAVVVLMTSSSIYLRAHLRKKYRVSYL